MEQIVNVSFPPLAEILEEILLAPQESIRDAQWSRLIASVPLVAEEILHRILERAVAEIGCAKIAHLAASYSPTWEASSSSRQNHPPTQHPRGRGERGARGAGVDGPLPQVLVQALEVTFVLLMSLRSLWRLQVDLLVPLSLFVEVIHWLPCKRTYRAQWRRLPRSRDSVCRGDSALHLRTCSGTGRNVRNRPQCAAAHGPTW